MSVPLTGKVLLLVAGPPLNVGAVLFAVAVVISIVTLWWPPRHTCAIRERIRALALIYLMALLLAVVERAALASIVDFAQKFRWATTFVSDLLFAGTELLAAVTAQLAMWAVLQNFQRSVRYLAQREKALEQVMQKALSYLRHRSNRKGLRYSHVAPYHESSSVSCL